MNAIQKNCWILMAVFFLQGGCSNPKAEAESPQALDVSDSNPVPDPSNPVTATRWCRLEDWTKFQIVLRMTAVKDQMYSEYLLLQPGTPITKYRFQNTSQWALRKGENPLEDNPGIGRFIASPVPNPATVEPKLVGFEEQKKMVETLLPNYADMVPRQGPFNPEVAMSLKSRDVYSGGVLERNVYPCSSYSPKLNEDAPERPMMELILKISSAMKNFTEEGLDSVARTMPLVEPIEEIRIEPGALVNTQWCAWRQVSADRVKLYTLTVSNGRFTQNTYTENFQFLPTDSEVHNFLKRNSKLAESYEITYSKGRMHGRNLTEGQRKYVEEDLFAMARDASGTHVLVRMALKQPDVSRPYFDDLYFDCAHPKPLEFSPSFASRIATILEMERTALNSPPEPEEPPSDSSEPPENEVRMGRFDSLQRVSILK